MTKQLSIIVTLLISQALLFIAHNAKKIIYIQTLINIEPFASYDHYQHIVLHHLTHVRLLMEMIHYVFSVQQIRLSIW